MKLYKAHAYLENAKTALRDLENKMQFHNEDELEPAENEEREAKTHEGKKSVKRNSTVQRQQEKRHWRRS